MKRNDNYYVNKMWKNRFAKKMKKRVEVGQDKKCDSKRVIQRTTGLVDFETKKAWEEKNFENRKTTPNSSNKEE